MVLVGSPRLGMECKPCELRFALFNIMTGVFVERAMQAAIPDRREA